MFTIIQLMMTLTTQLVMLTFLFDLIFSEVRSYKNTTPRVIVLLLYLYFYLLIILSLMTITI